jgi:hypothetical protein
MEKRVSVLEVPVGAYVVRIGNRDIAGRVLGTERCRAGQRVRGPRGGMYELTQAGANRMIVLVLANGKKPLVRAGEPVVLEVPDDTA